MKTYLVNNKYKIKADSAVRAAKLAKIVDSRKDSENIKLEQLTKGDIFYDPHYQEKCKIIEIDDDQYRVQSLTTGKTYWKNKRASVIKDATPIEVEKVVYSIDDIKVLEYTYDNRKMWIVTSNYNGEKTYYGGGTIEFTKSDAIQTAKNFATIHRLEKKYGTVEAHKRYVKGYKDAVVDKNKIEQIISSREFNFVKEDGNTQTYKFIGQNPYDKEYHFKELSKTLPGNVGLALSGNILTVSYRDSAIKDDTTSDILARIKELDSGDQIVVKGYMIYNDGKGGVLFGHTNSDMKRTNNLELLAQKLNTLKDTKTTDAGENRIFELGNKQQVVFSTGNFVAMENGVVYDKGFLGGSKYNNGKGWNVDDYIKHLKSLGYKEVNDSAIKDESDLQLLRNYFSENQPNKKMELRHKLKSMDYEEGVSGVYSRDLMWVKLNGKKYEVKNLKNVTPLDSFDSMKKDSENSVIEYLTEEEEKAVEDYKKAIQSTSNPTLLKMFQHILQEELEHIEELDGVKNEKGIQDDASLTSEIKEYFSENLPNIKITNIVWSGKQALIKTTNDDQAYKALKRDYAYNTVERNSNGIMIYFD